MGTVSQPKTHEQQAKERETEQRKLNIIIEGVNESVYGKEGDGAAVCEILTFIECKHRIKHINYIERIGRKHLTEGNQGLLRWNLKLYQQPMRQCLKVTTYTIVINLEQYILERIYPGKKEKRNGTNGGETQVERAQ